MVKLIIAGTRDLDISDAEIFTHEGLRATEIVCGMAKGVDLAGKRYAQKLGIPVKEFPARWELYGKQAGFLRNAEMADYADELLAFWDGQSRGTRDMINRMLMRKKPFQVILIR